VRREFGLQINGMANEKRFTGKWVGQYTLGDGYSERLKGKSGGFTILMEVAGNGKITGKCLDEGVSMQLEAVIEGSVTNGNINFIKKYRNYWQTDEDGNVIENKDRESHEVIYYGEYRNNVFAGEWKIITPVVGSDGAIRERVSGGYWIMHKEN
jgi:hypothetical protein